MNLNPLASVFVPQSSAKAIQPPLDSMAPTVSNSFHFNAEAEEFVPILPHIEESGDASNNIDINAMPGLNVYADVFVPRSTEYNQLAIEAVTAEEFKVGGQDSIVEFGEVDYNYNYALGVQVFEEYSRDGQLNEFELNRECNQDVLEYQFGMGSGGVSYDMPCTCGECLKSQNEISASDDFQSYNYDVGLDDGYWFVSTGEQLQGVRQAMEGGQGWVSNVMTEMLGNSGVPLNIEHDVEAEEVTSNEGPFLDIGMNAYGQGSHNLAQLQDADMPALIYADTDEDEEDEAAEEDVLCGAMVMHQWKPQAEQHVTHWDRQPSYAPAITVREPGEISQHFPASFQPYIPVGIEPMTIIKEVTQEVGKEYELKTENSCFPDMPDYISVTTPEIDGESGYNTSPTAYGQKIMLWSYNRDAICDRSSTEFEIDFYYPSSPRYDFCFCAGCARNAYEGVWEHLGVTGENWLTLQRMCSNCGGGDLLSGTWCEWCWACQCSACLIAKGYDIRFTGEQGIFNVHFEQKRGCLPSEWWHIFFVDEVQGPELGILEDLGQGTESEEETDVQQGTEDEEEKQGTGNEKETDIDLEQGTENEEATYLEQGTANEEEADIDLEQGTKNEEATNINLEQGTGNEEETDLEQGTGNEGESDIDPEQGTANEEAANIDLEQGTENEEATDLEHDIENGGETDVELALPVKCDWLAVAAVGLGVMAMWLSAVLV